MNAYTNIQGTQAFEEFIAKGPSVVMFSAVWCGPCQRAKQQLNEFIPKEKEVRFGVVDVDESRELADRFEIQRIPAIFGFVNGNKYKQVSGGSADVFENLANELKKAAN